MNLPPNPTPAKKPTSIKIALGLLVLIFLSKGYDLASALWFAAQLSGLGARIGMLEIATDLAISIAVLALVIAVWRWLLRRDSRGRWGLLALIVLALGRTGFMPVNQGAPFEYQLGYLLGGLLLWGALLLLGLRIIFSSSVKAYFASPGPAQNPDARQESSPPAG